MPGGSAPTWLRDVGHALAVVAHPDDESFGLGAVLDALTAAAVPVDLVCLTHGEASTLGAATDLGEQRQHELSAAARHLHLHRVTLLHHPDGHLADVAPEVVDAEIDEVFGDASLVIVFEPGGVTGHPDHRAATAAGLRAASRHGAATLEWGVPPDVAGRLRSEFGVPFVAFDGPDTDELVVDRRGQLEAISCHESQATDNPVLRRRLALQHDRERVRYRPAVA